MGRLVLDLKRGAFVMVGECRIEIHPMSETTHVRLCFSAPKDVQIVRSEVLRQKEAAK